MEYAVHDATGAGPFAADVHEVYAAVFGDPDGFGAWRQSPWERHRLRADFRLATAHEAGRMVGFGWGYTGRRGEYWPDLVLEVLPEASDWVGGHFELVELAVLPGHRGRGVGRRLHDLLLEGLPHERALLSTTSDETDPAVRLYRARGWRLVGLLDADRLVLGRRLAVK